MDGSGSDSPVPRPVGRAASDDPTGESEAIGLAAGAEDLSLEELADQLERVPGECWRACEGLESVEVETRVRIIQGLAGISGGAGVASLLQLLAASRNAETREAALAVLTELEGMQGGALRASRAGAQARDDPGALDVVLGSSREIVLLVDHARPRLVDCLVTAVDGAGRASIAISAIWKAERRTAVFLCDVGRGITDAVGEVEAESPSAGGLLDDAKADAGSLGVEGMPELALRLLAGSLSLNGPATARPVTEWLERTVGPSFEPRPLPAPTAESNAGPGGSADLLRRADEVLEACPTWLDSSPLTFELAEEIFLREGRVAADPHRDSGAFRFLFEHRIIRRLELYRRMLLWMAWFWGCAGEPELAMSARVLAWQLSDEQFAVPSHPFTVALTARSLDAARERLGTDDDPRPARGIT
jgi:hypothetical protein